jgi:hypothetical protein
MLPLSFARRRFLGGQRRIREPVSKRIPDHDDRVTRRRVQFARRPGFQVIRGGRLATIVVAKEREEKIAVAVLITPIPAS